MRLRGSSVCHADITQLVQVTVIDVYQVSSGSITCHTRLDCVLVLDVLFSECYISALSLSSWMFVWHIKDQYYYYLVY